MTRRRLDVDDLYSFTIPEQPTVSPDGSRVVYVLRTTNRTADRDERNLWSVNTDGSGARRLTQGPNDSRPSWSPDGRHIAFSRAQDGPGQLWLLPSDGGEPRPVTDLPLGAGPPVWGPEGRRIAFTAPVDAAAFSGAESPQISGPNPVVVDHLDYLSDGTGMLGTVRTHLHIVDVESGQTRRITVGDRSFADPAWSPDGTRIALHTTSDPDSDLSGHTAAYVLDVSAANGSPMKVGPTNGSIGPVIWTADGLSLLAVGRAETSAGHSGLLRISLDGTDMVDLVASLDRNVMAGGSAAYPGALPQVVNGGGVVLFCARNAGCTHLYSVDLAGGSPRVVVGGSGRVVCGVSAASKGPVVLVLATESSYGEIVTTAVDGGDEIVCTTHSQAALSDVELVGHVRRTFTISDGTCVEGWLLRNTTSPEPQPLLLDIHGGPHNSWNSAADSVHLYHQVLVSRGWAILLLNPRGSDGYGERFYNAAVGSWGTADARDFLEPLDELVSEGIADPKRLAVAGYSYGGFMTCYLTGHDDRFAAAVAGSPVSDLISASGTADIGHHVARIELGSPWWSEPERFREISPITHVHRVRTPTLLLQGAADARCPAGQSQQWFSALREQGVPTQLVLYPEASHQFILNGRPSHRVDYNRRITEWVERFAGPNGGSLPTPIDATHWRGRLTEMAERLEIPGAALGILRLRPGGEDELVEASYGVLNTTTRVPTTIDSLFQIGSITKVWTTTAVMRLVETGQLELDAPILDVVPELRLADPLATKQITMRHLLTHSSGIDGDLMTDTGRGDDCVEKYVALLDQASQIFPVGASWSYCNAGFVLAGRVIEKLTGLTWDRAVRDLVITPLGLRHTITLPEEALLFRTAVGHLVEDDGEQTPAPFWALPRSMGPAGLISSTIGDVLAFARMHLSGGLATDGSRVLGAASATSMQDQHAQLPDVESERDSWGLGWGRFCWDGHRLVGHDGGTVGQSAFLRLLPEEGLAVVLLTNANNGDGGHAGDLYEDLFREIFAEVANVRIPDPPVPPQIPVNVDTTRHAGLYEREGMHIEVLENDGTLTLQMTGTGPIAESLPSRVNEYPMIAVDENHFLILPSGRHSYVPVTFYSLASGQEFVHLGVRATPRIL